ncbi:hypothetical protein VNO77_23094 [Canavalia gladiata]|uniref:Uncharacterized protein n=1 Tax=Canavalia gladiata TaxID=3824 RepID=A0AAN9QBL1_CANGL
MWCYKLSFLLSALALRPFPVTLPCILMLLLLTLDFELNWDSFCMKLYVCDPHIIYFWNFLALQCVMSSKM